MIRRALTLLQAAQSGLVVTAEGVEHGQIVMQQGVEGRVAGVLADDAVQTAGLDTIAAGGQLAGAAEDLPQPITAHSGG